MTESQIRVWKKIAVFYALTLVFSAFFQLLDRGAPGNITLITGMMWCPGLSAILTKRLFGESVRDLGWSWGTDRKSVV